ncbi:PREDICTED: RNA-binding protein 28 [Trachymyrmex cornetzi]|uniref:RNA-binding protein 28 n=1 Tax=Trachymyrmex cornetzi TaxID=471704 RepID=A0A195ECE0_9HYME|nr:PREDICTED: RNA-binding protein 28 [Trachymyrmex cornetzi]KYN22776.1 RNA-binding protein 28 [Trachymyrmex cornetzi]
MGKPSYGQRREKGKTLSWMYRKKAKLRRAKSSEVKVTDTAIINEQNSRIIVKNLSFKATEEDVRRFYEPFGEIKEINFMKRPDGNPVGCFIDFKRVEDASKAIFNTNKKEFLGRNINSSWAISKLKFSEKLEKSLTENQEIDKDEGSSQDTQKENDDSNNTQKKITNEKNNLRKQKIRKLHKMRKQKKRARIVIRNLAFQVTEVNLKEHFAQYGEIEEIKILTKPDGKPAGVAFLQYNFVQNAAKAIHYANMLPLLNRPMIVDWAVPKTKFSQNNTDVKVEVKTEPIDEDEVHNISEINASSNSKNDVSDSDAESDREVTVESIKEETESDDEIKIHETEDTDDEDESDDSNNDNDSNVINRSVIKEEDIDQEEKYSVKRPNRVSNDVNEGKTIFLKNIPFSVKNDELKKCMEQFGPVYYALVCIDPLTEYSRGTAFVKFQRVEDAENCLLAGTELRLRDQIIEAHRALRRNEVEDKKNLKGKKIKDSRNLYLIKEGVVLAKSPAAAEVSVSDMEKRLKLEQWKSQMLRNLNMFVSRVRLAVHNLPSNFDNEKLRQLFKNHSGPKAIIKEARVMRDLKNIDATGKGKSKEYGFVTFTSHEDALKALRSINNNPNIFSKSRRPIVGFSIENRILVNAKERRIQKSREHNPLWSGNKDKKKNEDKKEVPTKRVKVRKLNDQEEKSYAGMTSKFGQDKLRSNFNLKSQADLHTMTVKKQKKLNKAAKQLNIVKQEKIKKRQDNVPLKKAKKFDTDDANFNKLLNNYRNKLKGIDLKKSKWYESLAGS